MSMILRLQRDKSEAMMEARQYRRYAEERFAHDAAERDALRGEVERREAAARALAARLRACQARLLHLGFPSPPPPPHPQTSSLPSSPTAADSVRLGLFHPFLSDDDEDEGDDGYRSVQCLDYHPAAPADVGTPRTHHLLNRTPSPDADPKGVVLSGSPRHARTLSGDSIPRIALADEFSLFDHRDAPDGDGEDGDRVYTVDAVHGVPVDWGSEVGVPAAGAGDWAEEGEEIQKLKARLQALEADRESMRHAIMSMGDEKAQVVLLREIAQQLCRDAAPFPAVPLKVQPRLQPVVVAQRKVVKKQTSFVKIFIMTVIKWVASIFCWRRKSNRIRYPIGMCGSNVGLMLVLDRFPKQRQKKIPKRKLSASTL
ncbi:hypothetical protein GQ55_8G209500 [Panicum hallii var. hallii]|uniref:GTD-binding domain-containing protein n=1 Tax=Panicum hallii var. hallii TaxID=1504633 RepID=A0A2T7CPN3_9POAL|nr:hypothetical protein GQ55_8G209500 [Panicum hallii var. hallii]